MLKTDNKLIGDIENNELYNSDDDLLILNGAQREIQDDMRNQDLDFTVEKPAESKEKEDNKFLMKMKLQKKQKLENQSIEQQVINLGFIRNLAQKMSANEMAASGIQLSIRENIIEFIKGMDQTTITKKEQNLLNALQNSQDKEATGEDQIDSTKQAFEVEKPASSVSVPFNENSRKLVSSNYRLSQHTEEEESGLLFYDPEKEAREQREKALLESHRNRQNLLKDSGAGTNAATQAVATTLFKQVNHRTNFLTNLKQLKNKKNAMSLEKVKSTFQATELLPETNKSKTSKKADEDEEALEDRESDSDFDPEKHRPEEAEQLWDDEENFVAKDGAVSEQLGESQEEEDFESKSEAPGTIKSDLSRADDDLDAKSMQSNQLSETSQIIGPKRRAKKEELSAGTSQASQIKREKLKQRRKIVAKGFFDEEAELGSDDEEKDDVRKVINKNDVEENEEGLDDSLDGFVEKD